MEISLFGPGIGECCLIELPTGQWIIIDSFRCPEVKQPIALKYFEEKGLDPKLCVDLIIITHWHSDHVAGMSELIDICDNALIVIPSAFTNKEFNEFWSLISSDHELGSLNTLKEMRLAMESIRKHFERNKQAPKFADEGKNIYYRNEDNYEIEVTTLSPSPDAFIQSQLESQNLLKTFKASNPKTHLTKPQSNNNAIAIQLTVNGISLLFGGDLEEPEKNQYRKFGWSRVLDCHENKIKRSILFKVPHHGSETGHQEEIWQKALIDNATAILTTFDRSNLPKDRDIERIKSYTSYLTGTTMTKCRNYRDKRDIKNINDFAHLKPRYSVAGHVKYHYCFKENKLSREETSKDVVY
jgi:beta-lactamase superfamily II metal-dependent hydrolase